MPIDKNCYVAHSHHFFWKKKCLRINHIFNCHFVSFKQQKTNKQTNNKQTNKNKTTTTKHPYVIGLQCINFYVLK